MLVFGITSTQVENPSNTHDFIVKNPYPEAKTWRQKI